jgi:hypothetical protein
MRLDALGNPHISVSRQNEQSREAGPSFMVALPGNDVTFSHVGDFCH